MTRRSYAGDVIPTPTLSAHPRCTIHPHTLLTSDTCPRCALEPLMVEEKVTVHHIHRPAKRKGSAIISDLERKRRAAIATAASSKKRRPS